MRKLSLLVFVLTLHFIYCRDEQQPLILTPLIEDGDIAEAQKAANVKPFIKGVVSYSGYITVNKALKSHLFFWFFPSSTDWTEAPLVVWLQGGPGASSLFALFFENGPYVFTNGKLSLRAYSWTKYFNVLYIDNPVGTGFSFTESEQGYTTNQTVIGENLHETLRQFLLLFPELQNNKIILSGESYAGKYVPALASTILANSKKTKPKMNVYGLFVGNPMISAEYMLGTYNEYLYSHTLLDLNGKEIMKNREEKIAGLIRSKKWADAGHLFAKTFFEGHVEGTTLFYELTGIPNHYHLQKDRIIRDSKYEHFLKLKSTKLALHVGQNKFGKDDWTVYTQLIPDLMKSMKPTFEEVLEKYRVLIFSGQMDIICPYYVNENLFRNLAWSGASDYFNAQRHYLNWGENLVGYYKNGHNFTEVLLRNTGHFVPTDKPQWALGLLRKFANGEFDMGSNAIDISF